MNWGLSNGSSFSAGGAGWVAVRVIVSFPGSGDHLSPVHLDEALVLLLIDNLRHLVRLLAVSADDHKFMLPLLSVPNHPLPALPDVDANLAGVGGMS
jgi:hypothetical protein